MTDPDLPPGLAHPEHAETMEAILRTVDEHNDAPDLEMVHDAFRLASYVHAWQERKSDRQPYIVHPLAVAETCANQRMDDVSVAAAILHDCIEDVDASFDLRPAFMAEHLGPLLAGIIEDLLSSVPGEGLSRAEPDSEQLRQLIHAAVALRFGPEVVRITEGLTKLRGQEVGPASDAELETLKRLLKATASEDIRTIIIKIFDRCDNIRTIDVFRESKQRRIAEKTLQFYVPIATRLGFFNEARLMEDHVMRVLQPDIYHIITDWLRTAEKRIGWRVEREVKGIRTALRDLGIPCRSKLYAKGIFSIWQGLPAKEHVRRRIGDGCNFNLLLVVDDEDACFRTLNLVHDRFAHLSTRVRDFINNPKVNGYQSIHTICTGHKLPKIQVLVRTEEMDLENHLGVISRLRGGELEDSQWIDELVESFQALGMDELLRLSTAVAFPEIDVFTPHGEARKLPEGATALDFAYDIHTEVGDHARVAVIDGRMKSLGTVLRDGQRVEIVTSGEVRPTYQWFGKVTTAKANIAIRKALKRLEEDDSHTEVRRFLRFCNRKLRVKLNPKSRAFHEFLGNLGLANVADLGRELMAGRTDYDHLLPALVETLPPDSFEPLIEVLAEEGVLDDGELEITGELDDDDTVRTAIHEAITEHVRHDEPQDSSIEIEGLRHNLPTRIARCCRPTYGDEIIAYTSRGRGASIHRRDCKAVLRMVEQGSAHVSPARWLRRPDRQLVRYDIAGTDRRGLFLSVSGKLADMGMDAQAIKLKAEPDGSARGYARVEVDDLTDREEIAARLRGVPGITSVQIRDSGAAPRRGVTYDDD